MGYRISGTGWRLCGHSRVPAAQSGSDAGAGASDAPRADDPGIALLEGAAVLGDILTFYQELYAQRSLSQNRQWGRASPNWCGLLGYRLSPALGGNAPLLLKIKGDQRSLFGGFPVKAEVEGLPKPADFEIPRSDCLSMAEPFQPVPGSKHSLHHSRYDGILCYAPINF